MNSVSVFGGTLTAIWKVYRADDRHVLQLAQPSIMCPSQFMSWQSCSDMYAGINKNAPLLFSGQDI